MGDASRNIVVLGSTGSIGQSTLEVAAKAEGRLRIIGLSAHRQIAELIQQADRFHPQYVAITGVPQVSQELVSQFPPGTQVFAGTDALAQLACVPQADTVVAAVVGSAGLRATWAAIEAGKRIALANKETLVMAGPLVMDLAQRHGSTILPIDSEHSAIFQAIQAGRREEITRCVLTASGGPFRNHSREALRRVTVEEALAHPIWRMGRKISVDSATLMNKALEIIEARWLFDLAADQIDEVIHPQSVVHSFVEFRDGSILAQLSPPDMKLPIQYALSWPERWNSPARKLDWGATWNLEFHPPDHERFPALRLGHEVARSGGTAGAVLNAANEAAVARFLGGSLPYHAIVPACQAVLNQHSYDANPTLEQLVRCDAWARQEIDKWTE